MNDFIHQVTDLFKLIEKALKLDDAYPKDRILNMNDLRDQLGLAIEIHNDSAKLKSKKHQRAHKKLMEWFLEYNKTFEPVGKMMEEDEKPDKKELKIVDKLDRKLNRFLKAFFKCPKEVQDVLKNEKEYMQKLNDLVQSFKLSHTAPPKDLSEQDENPELDPDDIEKYKAEYMDLAESETNKIVDLFKEGKAGEIDEKPEDDIHYNDIDQGALGDCYFLSALGAVAKANPEAIRKLITAKDDGTYDVKLYLKKKKFLNWSGLDPIIVNVTAELPVKEEGNGQIYGSSNDGELWVSLVEKAFAKVNGKEDKSKYKKIEGGFGDQGIEAITGNQAKKFNPRLRKREKVVEIIRSALDDKRAITCGTRFKVINPKKRWVLDNDVELSPLHEYYILSLNAAGNELEIRNPHGNKSYSGGAIFKIPMDDFLKYYNEVAIEL